MLEQLQAIALPNCKYIQLRFRYRVDNSNVKIFSVVLSSDNKGVRQTTVFDLLMSVKSSIIDRFLTIQHESVEWETVSITYPNSRFGTKQDILKLPLQGFVGACQNTNIDPYELAILNISLRFPGRPMPKQVKVHGVYSSNSPEFAARAQHSAEAFIQRFTIEGSGISYRIQFQVPNKEKQAKASKGKKKVIKRKDDYIEPKMCFWKTE